MSKHWKQYNDEKLKKGDLVKVLRGDGLNIHSAYPIIAVFTQKGFIDVHTGELVLPEDYKQSHNNKGEFSGRISITCYRKFKTL